MAHYMNWKKIIIEHQDATSLTYTDSAFDVVCAISALEHIPGNGDILAVLKPGGVFIFTAPYAPEFMESETDHYHHGYEKRYDDKSIRNRFSSSKKLHLDEILFIDGLHEDTDLISDFWYRHKLYNRLG